MASSEKVAIIHNPDHVMHSTTNPNFLETPERLSRIVHYLNKVSVFGESCVMIKDFKPASMDDVLRIHELEYVEFVKKFCERGGGFLGNSTYFSRPSFRIALQATGGAIEASKLVFEKKYTSTFALIRPPGHHALSNKFGGFCILNNAAVAAQYLIAKKKLKRILIIDWDAHGANGTMNIFYDRPDILLISIHQDPKDLYPREGFTGQIGSGEGRGSTVNIEMPNNSGDEDYRYVFEKIVLPVYEQYRPQFVIGCCGFDAHWSDDSSKLKLTTKGFHDIVGALKKIAGNVALLLEGGYSKQNGKLAHTVIKALLNQKEEKKEEISKPNVRNNVIKNALKLKKVLSEFYEF